MAENKKSFVLYADLIHTVKKMPDDKAGLLFKKILEYVNDLNPKDNDMLVDIVFEPIKLQMKRDLDKWSEIREKRVLAGKSGGLKSGEARAKQIEASASSGEANEAVNVTVTDTVTNKNINSSNLKSPAKAASPVIHVDKFIEWFNTLADRKFKVTTKVKSNLNARIKDGYTKGEIMSAAINAHKSQYHIESGFQHLTPEFILRPDKLEKYKSVNTISKTEENVYKPVSIKIDHSNIPI